MSKQIQDIIYSHGTHLCASTIVRMIGDLDKRLDALEALQPQPTPETPRHESINSITLETHRLIASIEALNKNNDGLAAQIETNSLEIGRLNDLLIHREGQLKELQIDPTKKIPWTA